MYMHKIQIIIKKKCVYKCALVCSRPPRGKRPTGWESLIEKTITKIKAFSIHNCHMNVFWKYENPSISFVIDPEPSPTVNDVSPVASISNQYKLWWSKMAPFRQISYFSFRISIYQIICFRCSWVVSIIISRCFDCSNIPSRRVWCKRKKITQKLFAINFMHCGLEIINAGCGEQR